jgi:hypothetical protein
MGTPTVYTSADASAPVLTGEAGKLIDLLDACLVNGYGAKAAAGWTKPYSSGNSYASFRQGGGLMHYLAVNDINTQMSRVDGFLTMSDFVTGTGPFPTEAQFTGGLYVRKSITASTQARPWLLVADERTFYLFIFGGSTTYGTFGGGDAHLAFGQLQTPTLAGDLYHSFLMAATDTSTTSTTSAAARQVTTALATTALAGHYMPRAYTQLGSSVQVHKRANNPFVQTLSGSGGVTYPDPTTGKLLINRIIMYETGAINRGALPGVWNVAHAQSSFAFGDTFSGSDALAGRTFLLISTAGGGVAIETTGGSWTYG